MSAFPSRFLVGSLAGALSLGVLMLSGCGLGNISTDGLTSASSFSGTLHGGSNPISGATVRLYSTGTGSYGAAGTLLGTATTNATGAFTFSGAANCASPQQEFLTATGGNPGSGANSNYILMAALGDCSTINTSSYIAVNEETTVAAAYALANFISISGNTVSVGAPATAAQTTGACVNTVNTTGTGPAAVTTTTVTSCTTAGLKHAFDNALNLVSTVGTVSALPSGLAYSVPPSNPTGEVPQALINSLANTLVACVNTTGTTPADATTPTSNCGKLFSYTTPPGGTAPANTVQAIVNLAKFPTLNVASIFALTPPQTAYLPTLTAAPNDYSLAVVYKGVAIGATTTNFQYPYYAVLDANDNVYVAATDASTATKSGMAAVSANGTPLFAPTYSTTYKSPRSMATDTLGNVWVSNNVSTAGAVAILQYSATASGAPTAYTSPASFPYGVAVDRQNNIWFAISTSAVTNLYELQQSGSYAAATFATPPAYASGPYGVAIDAFQNIWTGNGFPVSGGTPSGPIAGSVGLFPNSGTATAPAYANAAIETALTGTAQYSVPSVDGSGNLWAPLTAVAGTDVYKAVPSSATATPTSVTISSGIVSGANVPRTTAVDGGGTVWTADFNGTSSALTYNVNGTAYALKPCRAGSGATTCGTSTTTGSPTSPVAYNSRMVQIDSSGDIWSVSSTSGLLVQVLGTASPTWPQLSFGHPGVKP